MVNASTELINMMTGFLIQEIGSKAIDGITYTMVIMDADNTKDTKEIEKYQKYMKIRKEAQDCGYGVDEAFRVFEVSNGYIFDMDMSVAKKISFELSKAVSKTNGGKTPISDLIGNNPDKRRKSDMLGLAKYIKSEFDAGKSQVEVALFSKNSTPRITLTGIGPKNEMLTVKYNAYAIRHWDIETINMKLLMPAGIRVSKLEPCEILPSKTGVKFTLYIEPVY